MVITVGQNKKKGFPKRFRFSIRQIFNKRLYLIDNTRLGKIHNNINYTTETEENTSVQPMYKVHP